MVQNYKPISYFHSNDYWSFSKGTDKEKRQRGKERKWDLNVTAYSLLILILFCQLFAFEKERWEKKVYDSNRSKDKTNMNKRLKVFAFK